MVKKHIICCIQNIVREICINNIDYKKKKVLFIGTFFFVVLINFYELTFIMVFDVYFKEKNFVEVDEISAGVF